MLSNPNLNVTGLWETTGETDPTIKDRKLRTVRRQCFYTMSAKAFTYILDWPFKYSIIFYICNRFILIELRGIFCIRSIHMSMYFLNGK